MKNLIVITILLAGVCMGTFLAAGPTETTGEDEGESISLPYVALSSEVLALLRNSQWEEAVEKLERAYSMTMADPNLKYYLSYCYEQLAGTAIGEEKYPEAVKHLEKAIEYVNDRSRLYLNLGGCHLSLASYTEAEEALTQAIHLEPDNFTARVLLGEVYYHINDMENARAQWEAALKIKPGDKHTKKRLDQLKKYDKVSGDFETEQDNWFSVSFDGVKKPRLRELVLEMLVEISQNIGNELGLYPQRQIKVILLTNRQFFDITGSPGWAGGVYEGQIKVPVDKYETDLLRIVLTHEYIHAVIFDRLSFRCPWWLNEGLAQYMSGDNNGNAKKLEIAAQFMKEGEPPALEELPGDMLKGGDKKMVGVAYALGLSAVNYFIRVYGVSSMRHVLEVMAEGKSFTSVVMDITGYSFSEFQSNWHGEG